MQNYQTDWEAILARSPTPFIAALGPWLFPPVAREDGKSDAVAMSPYDLQSVATLREVLPSSRARLETLNWPRAVRI